MHTPVDLHTSSYRGVTCCCRESGHMSHSHCLCRRKLRERERERERERVSTRTKCCFICVRTATLLPPPWTTLSLFPSLSLCPEDWLVAYKQEFLVVTIRSQNARNSVTCSREKEVMGDERWQRSVNMTKRSHFRSHNSAGTTRTFYSALAARFEISRPLIRFHACCARVS